MTNLRIALIITAIVIAIIIIAAIAKWLIIVGIAVICYYCIILGKKFKTKEDDDNWYR